MIFFEFPLNERVRNYLRLEHLFDRLAQLVARDTELDHHFALQTLFELAETGSRLGNDLRADLHKDVERQIQTLSGYREHPKVDLAQLDLLLQEAYAAVEALVQTSGKMGQGLGQNEWLHNIRNRIHIPGGTCSFDLPSYYIWQNSATDVRRADLVKWTQPFSPWVDCIRLNLRLLRLVASSTVASAKGPQRQYQQTLDADRSYQLAGVGIEDDLPYYPVISGTRHLLSVRFHPRGKTLPLFRENMRENVREEALVDATSGLAAQEEAWMPQPSVQDFEVVDISFNLSLSA